MTTINVSNYEFLYTIFGDDFLDSFVLSNMVDPSNVPTNQSKYAWSGKSLLQAKLHPAGNQYFCVSLFNKVIGQIKSRKELFKQTNCIVIDDVRQKINVKKLTKLSEPSWILETSPGSEQWGFILAEPCTNRTKVEAVLNGLIKHLCVNGIDSGFSGVTRLVRLPEGYNLKEKYKVNGEPFKCRMLSWQPNNRIGIDAIVKAFKVDITKKIKENIQDVSNSFHQEHPIFNCVQLNRITPLLGYDIMCPWINEHTDKSDGGTMIWFDKIGRIKFKCHHGHCIKRNAEDVVVKLDAEWPGFMGSYYEYLRRKAKENYDKKVNVKCKINLCAEHIPKDRSTSESFNIDLPF